MKRKNKHSIRRPQQTGKGNMRLNKIVLVQPKGTGIDDIDVYLLSTSENSFMVFIEKGLKHLKGSEKNDQTIERLEIVQTEMMGNVKGLGFKLKIEKKSDDLGAFSTLVDQPFSV